MNYDIIPYANEVLALMNGNDKTRFEGRGNQLYVVCGATSKRVSFYHDLSFQFDGGQFGWGGTCTVTAVMLVRWIKGMPRYPVRWFESRWNADLVAKLRERGYDEPERICCILCGQDTVQADWWHGKGKQPNGPCCTYGKCQDKPATAVKQ